MTDPTNADKVAHAFVECSPQVEDDPREWMAESRFVCRALGIDPDGTDPHADAVAAERERCATVVDGIDPDTSAEWWRWPEDTREHIAAAIRARGDNDD